MKTASIQSRDRSHDVRDEQAPAPAEVTPDRIRLRAHQIFEARKGAPGNATLDWLRAEQELRAAVQDGSAAPAPGSKEHHETQASPTA